MKFDNGKELVNQRMKDLGVKKGMEIRTTAPYSPSQNGVAERLNRTLLELARAMLIARNLPAFLWDEAISHAVYLRNRVLTSALPGKTPYEAYHSRKPSVAHLREFGCDVWVLNEAVGKSKLDARGLKMVFVGFMDGAKAVRYYDAKTRMVKVSRNIAFNENSEPQVVIIPGLSLEEESPASAPIALPKKEGEPQPVKLSSTPEKPTAPPLSIPPIDSEAPTKTTRTRKPKPVPTSPLEPRTLRNREKEIDYAKSANPAKRLPGERFRTDKPNPKQTKRSELRKDIKEVLESSGDGDDEFSEESAAAAMVAEFAYPSVSIEDVIDADAPLPRDLDEALGGAEAEMWKIAVEEEIGSLEGMGTWDLEDLPGGRKAIGCRWVFSRKTDEHGNIIRYKARLVAQGFAQKPGIDYELDGVFAPVMRFETLRTVLALSATNGWVLFQSDVKSAYLNGHLTEEIYMRQPPGFDDGSGRVCRLRRSLYGLKQAGNVWNREFNSAMREMGYTQLKSDPCCYIRRSPTSTSILLLWVDDILGSASDDEEAERVQAELSKRFEVHSTNRPGMLLGMKITQNDDDESISLSQSHYIDSMLRRFGLEDSNSVSTPLDPHVDLDSLDTPSKIEPDTSRASGLYATAIGSLLYAAMGTRPDIAYATHRLAQFTRNPQPKHWTAVKRVLRYLKGTKDLALTFGGPPNDWIPEISTYCDADWASNADRKSISGYVVLLAGGAIAWSSKKQTSVALSTAEAEYVATTHVAKQVLWFKHLFDELGIPRPTTSTIFTDNQAAIAIAHHPEYHARTKHIDIALHFLRDHVQSRSLNTVYVNTRDNLADILTKGLARPLHEDLTYRIGLI
mgnify:FL=1